MLFWPTRTCLLDHPPDCDICHGSCPSTTPPMQKTQLYKDNALEVVCKLCYIVLMYAQLRLAGVRTCLQARPTKQRPQMSYVGISWLIRCFFMSVSVWANPNKTKLLEKADTETSWRSVQNFLGHFGYGHNIFQKHVFLEILNMDPYLPESMKYFL